MSNYLVDTDLFVYRVASACDGKRYHYRGDVYESIKEMQQIHGSSFQRDAVETKYTPETEEKAKDSFDKLVSEKIVDYPFADYYVGGKANFRYEVATIKDYKANRSGGRKPFHLDPLRQHTVDTYGGILPKGPWETDDEIAMSAVEGDTVITLDKDFLQLPDIKLYDFVSGEVLETTKVSALRCLYEQVLTGDTADNIPGLFMIGKKAKAVKDLQEMETEAEMFEMVLGHYTSRFHNYAEAWMAENLQLLYLLRPEGKDLQWIEWLDKREFYEELRK